jgi:transcriptional regulator with XRE-family HTH domain
MLYLSHIELNIMEKTFAKRPIHVGKNIQKFRFIRNKSQMDVATALEEMRHKPVSQQLISDIENRETIEDDELLQQIAEILKVDPEVLTNLDWDAAITVMGNTYTNNNHEQSGAINQPINPTINQTFNQLDKLIELFEKQKSELKNENEGLKKEIDKLKKGKK